MTFIYKNQLVKNKGISLLIAIIVSTVALAVGLSLLNVTLRQFILSNVARDSEVAFHAAYAGIECARFVDVNTKPSPFSVPSTGASLTCMDQVASTITGNLDSGDEQLFPFDWGTNITACTKISIYKFDGNNLSKNTIPGALIGGTSADDRVCAPKTVCTVMKSRGYNVACSNIGTIRTVEREITIIY